jgi:hypothetical protein
MSWDPTSTNRAPLPVQKEKKGTEKTPGKEVFLWPAPHKRAHEHCLGQGAALQDRMRYFIICDDSGNPIYYDHPEGMMACLIFNGLDQFLTERDEHFSQKFKSMWCGGVLFVAQKVRALLLPRLPCRHTPFRSALSVGHFYTFYFFFHTVF